MLEVVLPQEMLEISQKAEWQLPWIPAGQAGDPTEHEPIPIQSHTI